MDNLGFCVGVVLNVPPRARGQLPLGLLVQKAIVHVAAKPIAKSEHPIDLDTPDRKHVEIDVRVRSLQDSMPIPIGVADPKGIPLLFECG